MSKSPLLELDDVYFHYRQRHSLFRSTDFPVLNGVSLSLSRGQKVGIMGRNGAGKSTLLRLMAGIYKPDKGSVVHSGGKTSLLSLQAGFDQDLNGWDNAILSSVLMGVSLNEAKSRLPEIHQFCELGKQMDDPIRTYSTGMKARLGFAVAFTMQVDLMLVDEVMAVGDLAFQDKCQEAYQNAIDSGCAVVMVSHAEAKLKQFTDRHYRLKEGKLVEEKDS